MMIISVEHYFFISFLLLFLVHKFLDDHFGGMQCSKQVHCVCQLIGALKMSMYIDIRLLDLMNIFEGKTRLFSEIPQTLSVSQNDEKQRLR